MLSFAAVFSATSIALPAFTPTASSQEDPGVTNARQRLARVQAEASAAQARYEQAVDERDQARVRLDDLRRTISETRAQEVAVRSEIAGRAAALYKSADAADGLVSLDTNDPMEAARRTKFTDVTGEYYEERVHELRETADRLHQGRIDLQQKRTELDGVVARVEQEKASFDAKVVRAKRAVEITEKGALLRALGQPVMGPTVLTATEMADWLRSSGASPRLSGMSVVQLAQIFVDEGTAESVRGDVAFAQAYIETGGFSAGGRDNNFSGLGACDGCGGQNRFPTALDGIRAQMQLLKAYAGGGALVNAPSPYWWGGDPLRAFDSFSAKGSAPTWQMMGGGKWASDRGYASKVLGVYDRMIAAAEAS